MVTEEIRPEDRLIWGVEITKSTVDPETGNVIVEGIANSGRRDVQDEELVPAGIDYSYFLQKGHIKWEHHDKKGLVQPDQFIGEPLEARITPEGFFIKGMLYGKHKYTKQIVEQMETLEKSGSTRRMGFSIEGGARARDPKDPGKVTKSVIRNVVLTMNPVDTGAWARIAKSLDWSEDPLEFSLDTGGMAAVMPESLEGADPDPEGEYNDFAKRVRLVVGRWLGGMHRQRNRRGLQKALTPERIATELYMLADRDDVAEEAARFGYTEAVMLKALAEKLGRGELDMGDLAKSMQIELSELLKSAESEEADEASENEGTDGAEAGPDEADEWEPDDDEAEDEHEDEAAEKSFVTDLMKSSTDTEAALEVSEFLQTLVEQVGTSIDGFETQLTKSLAGQQTFNVQLAKSLIAMGEVVTEVKAENAALKAQLTEATDLLKSIANQPIGRRGVTDPRQVESLKKSITGADPGAQQNTGMSHTQILDKLVDAASEGKIPASAVTHYEVNGVLNPQVAAAVGISLN